MDTVRYLSVCLNTLNLPFVLQNESHEVTKYLKQLSTIPTSMLMADGLPLQTHLELIAEVNPAQQYLLSKQGYSFDAFKAEVLKFQKSKGYSDLVYEYKAVGTQINRPHHFLQKNIADTPPPPTPPIVAPEMPEKLIEPPLVENVPVAVNDKPIAAPSETIDQRHTPQSFISQKTIINPVTAPAEPVVQKKPPLDAPVSTEVIRSRMSPPTASPIAFHPPVPEIKSQVTPQPKVTSPRPMPIKPPILPQMSMSEPLKKMSLNAVSQTERVVQRASRITLPNLVSGGLKTIGSGLLGTIPGFSTNRTSLIKTSASFRGGGGGRGFIGRAIPLPSGGGRSWLVILLLLFGVIFILAFFFGGPMEQLSNSVDIKNIEIVKSAPQSVDNGGKITYNIIVRNKGSKSAQVVVSDAIPENSRYESGNNDPVASDSGKTVKNIQWTLSGIAGGEVRNLTFSVIPTKEDVWIVNQARGAVTIAGGGGNVQIPGNIPPNQNNCGGKWTFKTALGNYGDPECNFSKDDLYTLLKQLDPVDASYWFYTVVRCESTYDPNNFLGASASGLGAYGLYQMNPSGKGNGKYDAGDVIWQLQTSNAVNYNNQLSPKWRYWHCAQDRW